MTEQWTDMRGIVETGYYRGQRVPLDPLICRDKAGELIPILDLFTSPSEFSYRNKTITVSVLEGSTYTAVALKFRISTGRARDIAIATLDSAITQHVKRTKIARTKEAFPSLGIQMRKTDQSQNQKFVEMMQRHGWPVIPTLTITRGEP